MVSVSGITEDGLSRVRLTTTLVGVRVILDGCISRLHTLGPGPVRGPTLVGL